jgi:hypothetical protein
MTAIGSLPAAHADRPDTGSGAAAADKEQGHALLAQLGSEVASELSAALEQVHTLATAGKISRSGLRQLREHLEQARRIGIMGQQVERLAAGRVRQVAERVDLTAAVREALRQRRRHAESLGIDVRQVLAPAQVMADPALVFTLVDTLLTWCLSLARSPVDVRIELNDWPLFARLSCRFRYRSDDQVDHSPFTFGGSPLHTIAWRLLQQAARTMDLRVHLDDDGAAAALAVEFPRTVNDPRDLPAAQDRTDAERAGLNSKPLAGSHLLVVAARRETRTLVREAVRHMGLMIDHVGSVDEARSFCSGGLPHAILHESALGGDRFERLRADLLADMPHLVFIELSEDDHGLQTRRVGGRSFSCLGRSSIAESLPAALMFELSRPR